MVDKYEIMEKLKEVKELLSEYENEFHIKINKKPLEKLEELLMPEKAEMVEVVPQYVVSVNDNFEIMNVELEYIVRRDNEEYVVPEKDVFKEADEYEEQEDSYNIIRGNNVGERLGAELFKEMYKVVAENLDFKLNGLKIKKEAEEVVNELKKVYEDEDKEVENIKILKFEYELDLKGKKYKVIAITKKDGAEIKYIMHKPLDKIRDIIKFQERLVKRSNL